MSHQLRFLRERHAVAQRNFGQIEYYRLTDDHLRRLVHDGAAHRGEACD